MKWRSLGGRHPNVLNSYVKFRKQEQRAATRERGLWPRPTRDEKGKSVDANLEPREKKQRCGLEVDKVLMETMKGLVTDLPIIIEDEDK
jgi:hypothetical protein